MIDDLRPYSDYRDSAQAWLGAIPAHWALKRAKLLYREVDERSTTGEETLCSVSHKTGVTPRKANVTMFMAESTIGYKVCRPEDLVINTLWAWMAALGIAREVGVVSPAYGVYRPRPGSPLSSRYADLLLRTEQYKQEYIARSTGVNASRLRLYPEQFLQIPILLPPPAEQSAIVRFLAAVDRRVNRLVRAKRRLIELLTEQKQAVITHAVTRGLNPNAKLKPSGIDWLGEVPEHWEVSPLRRLGRFFKGSGGAKEDDVAAGVPCIRYGHLYMFFSFQIPESRTFITPEKANEYATVFRGDVLFAASGEDLNEIGKSAVNLMDEARCGGDVIVFRPDFDAHPEFLGYATDCWHAATQKARLGRGTTIKHIYESQLKTVCIVLPPKDEQVRIARHISRMTDDIDRASRDAHRQIALLREYRTRLVADVVTGMLDVRASAASLPSDEKPVVEGDLETLDETEEVDRETIVDDSADAAEAAE